MLRQIGECRVEPARTDSVDAMLVLLDLLKRQPERITQSLLGHAQHGAAHANPAADMDIDGVGAILGDGAARHDGHYYTPFLKSVFRECDENVKTYFGSSARSPW